MNEKAKKRRLRPDDRKILANGREYPVFFGPAMTPILMYLAVRPGVGCTEMGKYFDRHETTVYVGVKRLCARGLVRKLGWRFYINTKLFRFRLLQNVLATLASAYGITPVATSRSRNSLNFMERVPKNLFWTEQRTLLLVLVCALGETYTKEVLRSLGGSDVQIGKNLRDLDVEGLLTSRYYRRCRLYSIREDQPAYKALTALLRGMATDCPEFRDAIHAVLLLRKGREQRGTAADGVFYSELRSSQSQAPVACHGKDQARIGKHFLNSHKRKGPKRRPLAL
jgi:hypothetical protein